jgi:hypothetical protein
MIKRRDKYEQIGVAIGLIILALIKLSIVIFVMVCLYNIAFNK